MKLIIYPEIEKIYLFGILIFLTGIFSCSSPEKGPLNAYTRNASMMGSDFSITVISGDSLLAAEAIDKAYEEIYRIEQLISSWNPESQTSEINRNAGIQPVKVSRELFELIQRSVKVSELTEGAFDISFASIDQIWSFDGSMTRLPPEDLIARSVEKMGYENIILEEGSFTVFLKDRGMKIGFGAIGKGYAANRAKKILTAEGIRNGLVNAGGDLISWGSKADGKPWDIAIADPKKENAYLGWLNISDLAVVTSGNYERFAEIDGKKYGHIINPNTGYPAEDLKSVTILCTDAELSDALATAVFVMGPEAGLELINTLNGIECLLVTDGNELISSKGLIMEYY